VDPVIYEIGSDYPTLSEVLEDANMVITDNVDDMSNDNVMVFIDKTLPFLLPFESYIITDDEATQTLWLMAMDNEGNLTNPRVPLEINITNDITEVPSESRNINTVTTQDSSIIKGTDGNTISHDETSGYAKVPQEVSEKIEENNSDKVANYDQATVTENKEKVVADFDDSVGNTSSSEVAKAITAPSEGETIVSKVLPNEAQEVSENVGDFSLSSLATKSTGESHLSLIIKSVIIGFLMLILMGIYRRDKKN